MSNVNNNATTNIFEKINSQNRAQTKGKSTAEVKAKKDNDMFMRLMVAQLKNQSPTSPAKTSEFMQQIATMSQVEGINNLNTTMANASQSMLASQAALQASSMVGRSVYIPGNTAEVGTSLNPYAKGSFELESNASDVRIKVYSPDGSLVDTMQLGNLDKGEHPFAWQMKLDENKKPTSPAGNYQFTVEQMGADGKYQTVKTNMAHRVTSVSLGQNGIGMKINTSAGSFDVSKVKQIGV